MAVKIGIEMELGSLLGENTNRVLNEINWRLKGDPSIRTLYGQTEFISEPITIDLNNYNDDVLRIAEDYKHLIGSLEKKEVNSSMGMHIHISGLKNKSIIFSKEFINHIHDEYRKFAKTQAEKERINAYFCRFLDDHCDPCFHYGAGSDRYRAVNILGAWQKHKTFEFRFFPSTLSITKFKQYLIFLLKIIKKFENKKVDVDHIDFEIDNTTPEVIEIKAEVI